MPYIIQSLGTVNLWFESVSSFASCEFQYIKIRRCDGNVTVIGVDSGIVVLLVWIAEIKFWSSPLRAFIWDEYP